MLCIYLGHVSGYVLLMPLMRLTSSKRPHKSFSLFRTVHKLQNDDLKVWGKRKLLEIRSWLLYIPGSYER